MFQLSCIILLALFEKHCHLWNITFWNALWSLIEYYGFVHKAGQFFLLLLYFI